jgi:hypothetical protein
MTNSGIVTIEGGNPAYLNEGDGVCQSKPRAGDGPAADLDFVQSGAGDIFDNLPGGTFEFTTDSRIYSDGCCAGPGAQAFNNQGLFWKSGGTNSTAITVPFDNLNGVIRVDTGLLSLADGGSSSNGIFIVAAGATLDPTGNTSPQWSGQLTGGGQGQVLFSSGSIYPSPTLTLAFTNDLFQWGGGTFWAGAITNTGTVIIGGSSPAYLNEGAVFVNQGIVQVTGLSGLDLSQSGPGDIFDNLPGGTFEFTTDSRIYSDGCCAGPGAQAFNNQGLFWKSGGTNSTAITVPFNNLNGVIRVDTGLLSLADGGSSSNGIFIVAAGATLDPTGNTSPRWSGQLTGGGQGQVLFSSGSIYPSPALTLAFTNDLFQWGGGTFWAGVVTNTGIVIIGGSSPAYLNEGAVFVNQGLVQVTGGGGLDLSQSGPGDIFDNLPGGTFEFTTDSRIYSDGCCAGPGAQAFNNQGLFWKSGGTNTTTVSVPFNNQAGAIRVDSGTLSLGGNNYSQGGGALTIGIAGQGAGQQGQLALTGAATLSGPLNLVLAQGFVPAVGSQFQILSAGSLSGTFSSLNLPSGFLVNYSNASVNVTYTGAPTFVISAANNPASAGSVANTGIFIAGTTNLLIATPSYGYAFGNWSEGGKIVGTNAVLTNVVTANETFVADYTATNLTHTVTVTTSPEGVPGASGAGTYPNGQAVTISAPAVATNAQDLYTFQYFTLDGLFAGSNSVINTTFSTTNQPIAQFVAIYTEKPLHPQVVNVTANYGSPVPATTNFMLHFQFDRTMNTAVTPAVLLTNAAPGAVQPVVGTNGHWTSTSLLNDTYVPPAITFGPGMNGTVQVFVSGAQDPAGHVMALTNAINLTVNSTPPVVVISSPTNGASFTTTNSFTFAAGASSIYGIALLALYDNGTNLLASAAATNISFIVSGLAAGSYALTAVATDTTGLSATSAVAHVTINTPGTTLIDFEALNASAGPVSGVPLSAYLAGYGVSVTNVTTNTVLAVQNDTNILDGNLTVASSGENLLTQIGANGLVSYTLLFNPPYPSVSWTRTALLAGTGGVETPSWQATAYDANGAEIGSVGERQTGSSTNLPAKRFTLGGADIASITFAGNNSIGALANLPLDDLLLSTFAPGANISIALSAEGGTNYAAPGQITLTAAASETGGVISQIAFYEGENLLGTVTGATNATWGLTNVAAGTYTFTAVAGDGTYTRSSAPLNVNVAPTAGITVINFDALDATAGAVGGAPLSNYLAAFGVTADNLTLGTRVEAVNGNNLSGNAVAVPSSPPNLFTQVGLNQPVTFSLELGAPVGSFGFTRVALTAGPAGISHPAWTALAFNAAGTEVESVSEPLIFSFTNVPARTFQLTGPGITRVVFDSDSQQTASFSAVLLDDLVLDTNTAPSALSVTLQSPSNSTAPTNLTLSATVSDTLGTRVLRGLLLRSKPDRHSPGRLPGSIVWSNVLAGTYSIDSASCPTARATRSFPPRSRTRSTRPAVWSPCWLISIRPQRGHRAGDGRHSGRVPLGGGHDRLQHQRRNATGRGKPVRCSMAADSSRLLAAQHPDPNWLQQDGQFHLELFAAADAVRLHAS